MKEGKRFESSRFRLDDPESLQKFREMFVDRLEDLVTDPRLLHREADNDLPEMVRAGKKIPRYDFIRGVLAKLGQELWLRPDEIGRLEELFFESTQS